MDIRESIRKHAQLVNSNAGKVTNEPDTKRVLVTPFLEDVLDIDSRDPHAMKLEYPADWGDRNHKAVDYALMFDDKPLVIIEAKTARRPLDGEPLTQLRGYFSVVPEAKIGILTDGIKYRFYADFDDSKGLDSVPFLEIDFSSLDESLADDINHFHRDGFDADSILDWARERQARRMWQGAVTNLLRNEMAEPSDELVRLMMDRLDAGRKTRARMDEFREYIKTATSQLGLDGITAIPDAGTNSTPVQPDSGWVRLSEFEAVPNSDPPTHIRFADSPERALKYWRSIIDETVQWLFDSGNLKPEIVPFRYGRSRGGIVNTTPTLLKGNNMGSFYQVPSQQIFVDAHGSGDTVVKRARAILVEREVDTKDVFVKVR